MFNIRVYGVLINDRHEILLSDELVRDMRLTKFPGGGLEFGEGTRDCLAREFMEEMNLRIRVTDHLYTTDIYQQSAFNPAHQIISIYYYVEALEPITVPLRNELFAFDQEQLAQHEATGETETFRFVSLENFDESAVSLPIDKIVASLIKSR